MRRRVIGSALVVVVSLLPVLLGGPIFALFMIALAIAGFREYLQLVSRVNPSGTGSYSLAGYGVVTAFGCAALVDQTAYSLLFVAALSVALPLVLLFPAPTRPGGLSCWSFVSSGSLYLGLPAYAAIATRSGLGTIDAKWLSEAARLLALDWDPAPRGLAWVLTVLLATWLGDSVAFLVGRALGKRKLAPLVSPNKSQEGAIAGLLASTGVGAVSFLIFGLGDWQLGVIAGAILGVAGQAGDLAESVLKRQAGVKDSGSAVPGHGGILDRLDALLFAFPAGYLMAVGFERIGV